jgi:hypothetical protein
MSPGASHMLDKLCYNLEPGHVACFFFFSFFLFCGSEVSTRGFVLAKQVLYHLSHASSQWLDF